MDDDGLKPPRRNGPQKRIVLIAAAGAIAFLTVAITLLMFQDNSLAKLKQGGMIRIGYAVEPPFAFVGPDGEATGESPEVARAVVTRLGISRIEWRQMEFGALVSSLQSGQIDVIAAGMFITPERARHVRFSNPTFHVQQALLVRRGNPRHLCSYGQLCGVESLRVATLAGSIEEGLLQGLGMPGTRLVRVPDALAGRVAVESGFVDALALSSPSVHWMVAHGQLGQTEMAEPFAQPDDPRHGKHGYGAFAFRTGDARLCAAWNSVLQSYLGSPEHRALVARFGFSGRELPDTLRTTEVLSRP